MATPFDQDRMINFAERDLNLDLGADYWPSADSAPTSKWVARPKEGLIRRTIPQAEGTGIALEEAILRFPSAPIHGLHRLNQEHVNMGPVETFHTMRLLSNPDDKSPIKRIFLLHNGLNETDRMGLYYRLASHLMANHPGTVCILRPFPGHLTRYASPGLSQKPLDHYLWDGLHLFRQFLRFMIETRWLLSSLARYSYYHCVSGSGLLGEDREIARSRLKLGNLSDEMCREWGHLHAASLTSKDKPNDFPAEIGPKPFRDAIGALQRALKLNDFGMHNGDRFARDAEPQLHALGYSLGGFTAQSVFMSWPFLVSTCSTLLSGGAMRELAPTAFADPEEWQTVLHSLRYELDDAMMDPRFRPDEKKEMRVAGIDPLLFRFLKRTFYEVFEQEYRGSFQTRQVAFRTRMFYVVGGNDPIVRPQSVLDSAPPDGINVLQVGGLGHFLEGSPQDSVEQEQRDFWIPQIGQTIAGLAERAGEKHRDAVESTWLTKKDKLPKSYRGSTERERGEEDGPRRLSVAERLEVEQDGRLPSRLFERSLGDLLARVTDPEEAEGVLFILKNEAPTFLLDERTLQQHASALFHEDVGTADFIAEVRRRRRLIKGKAQTRIAVVMPWNLDTVTRQIDGGHQHPSQSESSGEQMIRMPDYGRSWRKLRKRCLKWGEEFEDSIRIFDPNLSPKTDSGGKPKPLQNEARRHLRFGPDDEVPIPASIPDSWVWMSNRFLRDPEDDQARLGAVDISEALELLGEAVPPCLRKEGEAKIAERLRADDLRILTISRARYNPRFRGRIVASPRQAQEVLLQMSLCVASSVPFGKFSFVEDQAVASIASA